MKRFNLMTERQMSSKDGGLLGIAVLPATLPLVAAAAGSTHGKLESSK